MITVGMNYEIREGKDEAFVKMFSRVIDAMNTMPGHQVTHLYRDAYNGLSFLIVSEWETEAQFNAFIASEAFAKTTTWGRENILASRPKHHVYQAGQAVAPVKGAGCPVHVS